MAKRSNKVSTRSKAASNVQVKNGNEVIATLDNFLSGNIHGRFNLSLSQKTQKQIVAYAPWISIALIFIILPELLILAKEGDVMKLSGFFSSILFNQEAWVVLLVILGSIMLLVDGIGDLFQTKLRGWQRVYVATLLNAGYILWQLFDNLSQPAPAILSLLIIFAILFTQLDIKKYYK